MRTTKEKGHAPVKDVTPTTRSDDTALTLVQAKDDARIDSRLMAQHLGVQHESVAKTLNAYADDFRELGIFRFQIGKPPAGSAGGRPERYALLNEDQAYLLLTYSRNTKRVRGLKVRLVKAFREARQAQDLHQADYLPTYHALHDELHALAGSSTNENFIHMNFNKLVNKAVGIEPGQLHQATMPVKSLTIAAQFIATQAMRGATDHKEAYQQAKAALERFGATMLGVSHA